MTEKKESETKVIHEVPSTSNQSIVLRIPRLNAQVVILGLIAIITLFQTFQLVRINASSGSAPVKVSAPAASSGSNSPVQTGGGGAGNSDVPQSMVGGC